MKLLSILFEKWDPENTMIDGKKVEKDYTGTGDTIQALYRALDRVPEDRVKSIKVPKVIKNQPNSSDYEVIEVQGDWKDKVRDILEDLESKSNGTIYSYQLLSFFGAIPRTQDQLYIKLNTKSGDDFGNKMAKGEFGSLD